MRAAGGNVPHVMHLRVRKKLRSVALREDVFWQKAE
jgi:hypothetical protein